MPTDPEISPPPLFCVEKCSTNITAFQSDITIKNLAFLNNRNDAVIISLGNSVYALELDRREVQNFEPIYIGVDPRFYKSQDNTIYILDGSELRHIVL